MSNTPYWQRDYAEFDDDRPQRWSVIAAKMICIVGVALGCLIAMQGCLNLGLFMYPWVGMTLPVVSAWMMYVIAWGK